MKQLLISIAVTLAAVACHAQNAPVILTVDINQLYQEYDKAQEALTKFKSAQDEAQTQFQDQLKKRNEIAEVIKDLREKANSDAVSDTKKKELMDEANTKLENLQALEGEINQFRNQSQQFLNERYQSMVKLHYNEIQEIVREVAKEKGANLVLNSSGRNIVYQDENTFDITADCAKRLNEDSDEG